MWFSKYFQLQTKRFQQAACNSFTLFSHAWEEARSFFSEDKRARMITECVGCRIIMQFVTRNNVMKHNLLSQGLYIYRQAVLMTQNRKEPVVFTFTICVSFRFEAVISCVTLTNTMRCIILWKK